MAGRGPQRTPLRILEGRGSKHARGRKLDPAGPGDVGPPPKCLTKDGRRLWTDLRHTPGLTALDRVALGRYVDLVEQYKSVRSLADAREELFLTAEGLKARASLLRLAVSLSAELRRLEDALSLTPRSRDTDVPYVPPSPRSASDTQELPNSIDHYVNTGENNP